MANTEKDVLEFGVFVDIRESLKAIEQFQREMTATMREISKSSESMGKTAEKAAKRATDASEDQVEAVEDVAEAYDKQNDAIKDIERTLENLRKIAKKKHGEDKKELDEQIKGLEKRLKAEKAAGGSGGGGGKGGGGKEGFWDTAPQKAADRMRKAGEALKEPLQNFLQKDAKGLMETSFKMGGKTLARSMQLSAKGALGAASGLSKMGASASTAGKMRGGGTGAMLRMGGGGMKAMGAVMDKLGKSLSFLTKLGPILGVASSAIMGLLKLFVDADGMVKEFNKDILQSASNAEMLARAGGDVEVAMVDMDNTLQGLRDAALDFRTNMALGITKEEHKAVINVLNQEGVSLARINDEAEQSGKSVRELATQLTTTGVAYSRAFGVPLQEINQLQARMMTEMGRSLGETQQSFAMMTRAATESSIASNKFFGMIRGVASDLSLYNLRLEDSVALLSKLGNVMSPENAQKFLQSAMTMAKGMGRQQKLQMGFFVGAGKLNKIVSKDIERDSKNLMQKISQQAGIPAETLQKAFEKDGAKGLNQFLDNVPKEAKGAIMESIMDLQLKSSSAKKGMYGQSQTIGDLGPGAFLEALNEAITRFSPGKDIAELRGSMGLEQTAEALGISQEQVDQMAKLQLAVDLQRQDLLKQAEGDTAETKRIQEMTTGDIINGFSDEMKKNLKIGEEGLSLDERMEAMAKEQGQRTQSITQKLENLVDWFMGAFYDAILGIWEVITSIPRVGNSDDRKRIQSLRRARQYGTNDELTKIAQGGGNVADQLSKSQVMKDLLSFLRKGDKSEEEKARQSQILKDFTSSFSTQDMIKAMQMDTGFKLNGNRGERSALSRDLGSMGFEKAAEKWGMSQDQITTAIGKLGAFTGSDDNKLEAMSKAASIMKRGNMAGGAVTTTPQATTQASPSPSMSEGTTPQKEQVSLTEMGNETLSTIATGTDTLNKAVTRGVKLDRGQIKSDLASEIEQAMLSALRQALYEYYLYSGIQDRSKVAQAFGKAGGAKMGASALSDIMGKNPVQAEGALAMLQGNATGGLVTGVSNGLAQVTAAAGEGLASVGRGERIVPAGSGGGNTFPISVNGVGGRDLANLIETKVVEGIREFKRRERFD